MIRLIKKCYNYLKYGRFAIFENLGEFVEKYGNGGTYIYEYDERIKDCVYIGTM